MKYFFDKLYCIWRVMLSPEYLVFVDNKHGHEVMGHYSDDKAIVISSELIKVLEQEKANLEAVKKITSVDR